MESSLDLRKTALFVFASAFAGAAIAATATIDVKATRQVIRGFGTCSAWNGTLTSAEGALLSAYRDSALSRVVLVAINANTSATAQEFSIPGIDPVRVTPWITDATRNIVALRPQALSSTVFSQPLPPSSVTTLVVETRRSTGTIKDGFRSVSPTLLFRGDAPELDAPVRSETPLRLELLDMRGRTVASAAFHGGSRVRLELPSISRGAYVARLSAGRETILSRSILKD